MSIPVIRLIPLDSPRAGAFQMAADRWCTELVSRREAMGVLRFYAWSPPTVSLGCHQSDGGIDFQQALARGWRVVKRPTGGRALLHFDDLSYAVVLPQNGDGIAVMKRIYRLTALALCATLQVWGIPPDTEAQHSTPDAVKLCMSSRVRGEVSAGGRKFAAAAQRIYDGAVLQHGSIAVRQSPALIADVVAGNEGTRRRARVCLERSSASLKELTGRTIEPKEFADAFQDDLKTVFGWELTIRPFSNVEISEIEAQSELYEIVSESRAQGVA